MAAYGRTTASELALGGLGQDWLEDSTNSELSRVSDRLGVPSVLGAGSNESVGVGTALALPFSAFFGPLLVLQILGREVGSEPFPRA